MSSPPKIDYEELLSPISDEAPVGADLRRDESATSPYFAIKRERAAARDKERSDAEEEKPPPLDEWRLVETMAREITAKTSKDLEVVAWLTEAMVRLQGFAGLRDSLRLIRSLIELFWDDIYPRPRAAEKDREEALETKVAPLIGLNGEGTEGTLIVPIRKIPLTQLAGSGPYAQWHYQKAVSMLQRKEAEVQKRGTELLTKMEKTAAQTDLAFFSVLRDDLRECQEEFEQLCHVLKEKCGPNAPPSSNIRNALGDCMDALRFFVGKRLPEETDSVDEAEAIRTNNTHGSMPNASTPKARNAGTLSNRDEAFAALLQLAAHFRSNEPHSPVSYLLEQAVRWGRMPLPELWQELISDEQSRGALFKLTGIRPPAE